MAYVRITDLPPGANPNGSELIEAVQNGVSVQLTLAQVQGDNFITSFQFKSALANAGVLFTVFEALPGNITNSVNISYTSSPFIPFGGILANFVQSTLGWSTSQMIALFAAAAEIVD